MSNDINFLSTKGKITLKKKKVITILRIIAVFLLITVGALSLLSFYLNRNLYPQSLKHEYDSLLQSISFLHNKEAKLAIINNRLESITELFGKRKGKSEGAKEDYSKTITKFTEKLPAGVKVDSLKADKKTILLTASSSSLSLIDEFINNLIDLGQDKIISQLLLDSLYLNDTSGTYSVSLIANL